MIHVLWQILVLAIGVGPWELGPPDQGFIRRTRLTGEVYAWVTPTVYGTAGETMVSGDTKVDGGRVAMDAVDHAVGREVTSARLTIGLLAFVIGAMVWTILDGTGVL